MKIPAGASYILKKLNDAGFEAYAVGGCVRDRLLGKEPEDWDVCTSAKPWETERCFSEHRVIETGLKHGTVTVMLNNEPYEITTFRKEGAYLGHRAPESVDFVSDIQEDLLRRDFTINAMAADCFGNIVDLYDGQKDLERGMIRAVGNPDERFDEDALRILRGIRFASQLGFRIEHETKQAMLRKRELLHYVSGERIYKELTKLLMGDSARAVLEEYAEIIGTVLPEILPSVGFCQHNPQHHLDVWEHTIDALARSEANPIIRWTLLLHDLGKPECFLKDERGIGHFKGHPACSAEHADEILRRLHVDHASRERITMLVLHHDDDRPAGRNTARRLLSRYGEDALRQLMEVRRCDILAHRDTARTSARWENHCRMTQWIEQVLRDEGCTQLKNLNIGGRDLLALGVAPGREVGRVLNLLLEDVLEERCENRSEALLERARQYLPGEKRGE